MKRKTLTAVLCSAVLMLLCGCVGGPVEISPQPTGDASTVSQAPAASEAASSSATESSEEESEKESTEESSKAEENINTEESSRSGESSEPSKTEQSEESLPDGEIAPREYIDPLRITIDVSDEQMRQGSEELGEPKIFYIRNPSEMHDFYEKNKTALSLDQTDGGLDFNQAVGTLDSNYFEQNDVVIIAVKYASDKEYTFGDIYKGDGGAIIDIYKDAPSSADNASYVVEIVGALKSALNDKQPELNILPAGDNLADS